MDSRGRWNFCSLLKSRDIELYKSTLACPLISTVTSGLFNTPVIVRIDCPVGIDRVIFLKASGRRDMGRYVVSCNGCGLYSRGRSTPYSVSFSAICPLPRYLTCPLKRWPISQASMADFSAIVAIVMAKMRDI